MNENETNGNERMVVIDARGIACPGPVIQAKKALEGMKEKNLKILVDNPAAVQNLERLGAYMGLKTESENQEKGQYQVHLFSNQGDECSSCEAVMQELTGEDFKMDEKPEKKRVVVISSDTMGKGDDVLGRLLMKGFIYALTELETAPETVILYNGGAKLSINGSDSVEDLKTLESQGSEIMTCGTCLNHYGITDQLAVGRITNMYEIAEKMMAASFLVKP